MTTCVQCCYYDSPGVNQTIMPEYIDISPSYVYSVKNLFEQKKYPQILSIIFFPVTYFLYFGQNTENQLSSTTQRSGRRAMHEVEKKIKDQLRLQRPPR